MIKAWGKAIEILAYSITKLDFRENALSSVPCSVLAKMKSEEYVHLNNIQGWEGTHNHFVSNRLGLFYSRLVHAEFNSKHGSPPCTFSFCRGVPSLSLHSTCTSARGFFHCVLGFNAGQCLIHNDLFDSLFLRCFLVLKFGLCFCTFPSTAHHSLSMVYSVTTVVVCSRPEIWIVYIM